MRAWDGSITVAMRWTWAVEALRAMTGVDARRGIASGIAQDRDGNAGAGEGAGDQEK
jgi:hypothetical protein